MKSRFSEFQFLSDISNMFVYNSKIVLKAYLAVGLFIREANVPKLYIFNVPPVN